MAKSKLPTLMGIVGFFIAVLFAMVKGNAMFDLTTLLYGVGGGVVGFVLPKLIK